MKKHFQIHRPVIQLSLEEEAVVVGEIRDDEQDATAVLGDIATVEDTSKALEDVIVIGESTPDEQIDANAILVSAVSDMAVAGTDAAPESLIEQPVLSVESLDGIRSKLKQIWEFIKEMLGRLWAHIKAIFGKYASLLESYKAKLTQQLEALKDAKIPPGKETQKIQIVAAGRTGHTATMGAHLLENWDIVRRGALEVLKDGTKANTEVGRHSTSLLRSAAVSVKNADSGTVLNDLVHHVERFTVAMTHLSRKVTLGQITELGAMIVDVTAQMPGGYQLKAHIGNDKTAQTPDSSIAINKLNTYLSSTIELAQEKSMAAAVEITLPKPELLASILGEAIDVLEIAIEYVTKGEKEIFAERAHIEAASKELVQAASSATATTPEIQRYVQTLLRVNKHYATTSVQSGGGMLKVIRVQAAAIGTFTKKCMEAYTEASPLGPQGTPAPAATGVA